jgi:hypothetical protein
MQMEDYLYQNDIFLPLGGIVNNSMATVGTKMKWKEGQLWERKHAETEVTVGERKAHIHARKNA